MNCPNCNKEGLALWDVNDEIITPCRKSNELFPIDIMVMTFKVYKCDCGCKTSIPITKHYYPKEE